MQRLGECRDLADDDERGRAHAFRLPRVLKTRERRDDDSLLGA
jgi:hypothetical protein